jgi:hypothetical protein
MNFLNVSDRYAAIECAHASSFCAALPESELFGVGPAKGKKVQRQKPPAQKTAGRYKTKFDIPRFS